MDQLDKAATALRQFVEDTFSATRVVFMGIDPGAEGAIALLQDRRTAVVDIPTMKVKKAKGYKVVFDHQNIFILFAELRRIKHLLACCLEQAQVHVGRSFSKGKFQKENSEGRTMATTAFRVGVAYGMWPMFLKSRGIPLTEVAPISWKSRMGLQGQDKEDARQMALRLFPKADIVRKKDHNRAEALLLAEYLRRETTGKLT